MARKVSELPSAGAVTPGTDVVYMVQSGNTSVQITVDDLLQGITDAVALKLDAADLTAANTPSSAVGTIAATNVQAAIAELDTTITGVDTTVAAIPEIAAGTAVTLVSSGSGPTATITINVNLTEVHTLAINAQTGTTYTPVLSDAGKLITYSNAGAITITMPQNSDVAYPNGTQIHHLWLGAGQPGFTNGTGATVVSRQGSTPLIAAQNVMVTTIKISTNGWLVTGELLP